MSDAAPDPESQDVAPVAATPPAEVSAGAQLRQERLRQGLSLADVARHLKLAPRQVEALEQDAYKSLPGSVFVRGFTRNYARLLGLDAEMLVRLAEQSPEFPEPALAGVPSPAVSAPVVSRSHRGMSERSQGRRGWVPVTASLIIIAVGILYLRGRGTEVKDLPPDVVQPQVVQPAAPTATAPAEGAPAADPAAPAVSGAAPGAGVPAAGAPTSGTPAPTAPAGGAAVPGAGTAATTPADATKPPAPVPAPKPPEPPAAKPADAVKPAGMEANPVVANQAGPGQGSEIRLSFSREAWVEVKDASGSVIFSQLNAAGSERSVRGQPPFQLVVGSASGVSVTYNAKSVDLAPHTRTDVARFTLE